MTNPLIISRLIETGYRVFLPVDCDHQIVVGKAGSEGQAFLQLCNTSNASQDSDKSPIMRCSEDAILSAVCDAATRTVWIIPASVTNGKTTVRLGKLCEEFIIPEPLSRSYLEQKELRQERFYALKERAFNVGKELSKNE